MTWAWTRTIAGWGTGARRKALEDALPLLVCVGNFLEDCFGSHSIENLLAQVEIAGSGSSDYSGSTCFDAYTQVKSYSLLF